MIVQRRRNLAALLLLALCVCASTKDWSWRPLHHGYLIDPRPRSAAILSNNRLAEDEDTANTTTTTTITATATPETESQVRRDQLVTTTNTTAVLAEGRALRYRRRVITCGYGMSFSRHPRIMTPDIILGTAYFGEFPWHAAVLKGNKYECGAVLVDARHVLTAAHCVAGSNTRAIWIRLGEWDVSSSNELYRHVDMRVRKIMVHRRYYSGNNMVDLAVIRLKRYINFDANPHIRPICLPPHRANFVGHRCVVTGWGINPLEDHNMLQRILRKVEVPVVDRATCEAALSYKLPKRTFRLFPSELCAGGEKWRDACSGDSGGPLVCKDHDGAFQLAGIVSSGFNWGVKCGHVGMPGLYVNVARYTHWIHYITSAQELLFPPPHPGVPW